jgi:hypothetical protein
VRIHRILARKGKIRKRGEIMPVKIVQSNSKVAEVQYICDECSKLVKTSLVPKKELEELGKTRIVCYQCKEIKKSKK